MNKPLIVFKALLQGRVIDFGDCKVKLFKPNENVETVSFGKIPTVEYFLAFEMIKDIDKKVYVEAEFNIDDFIERSENLSEECVIKLAMENALNEQR